MVQKIYSKMHLFSCTNTHDVTDLINHEMVKNTKTWISPEQNIIFLRNKRILNLCFRWHILRSYRFVAEVTFQIRNIKANCRFYKTSVYISAYSWTTESTSEINSYKHNKKQPKISHTYTNNNFGSMYPMSHQSIALLPTSSQNSNIYKHSNQRDLYNFSPSHLP